MFRPTRLGHTLQLIALYSLLFFDLVGPNKAATHMDSNPKSSQDIASSQIPDKCFLFSYFVDEKDGLHLAWSKDGLNWQAFKQGGKDKIFLKPTVGRHSLMRDPCLLLGPDNVFRLVWTVSWGEQSIGYASSPDLLHWSVQQALPVMEHEPTARNSWAPEVHYDDATQRYLIFWASTIPGRFPETDHLSEDDFNHRIYLTTTKSFTTFTPTTLFFDPKFCVIDATILPFRGKFYMIVKKENLKPVPDKDLYVSVSPQMMGPYGSFTGPIATKPPHWIEGPSAIQLNGKVVIYYDCYGEGHYGACESSDMQTWTDITPALSMPKGCRHGTVLAVPGSVISTIQQSLKNQACETGTTSAAAPTIGGT